MITMYIFTDMMLIIKLLLKNYKDLKNISKFSFCIVTAADSAHFIYLKNFIKNFKKLNHDRFYKLIIYDLGLDISQVQELKDIEFLEIRNFPFENYPNFYSSRLKEHRNKIGGFAWKPAIINILKNEGINKIMWFDSATEIKGSLNLFKLFIYEYGFSSFYSSGNVQDWAYSSVIKKLKLENLYSILNSSNLMAGVIGFDFNNSFANSLLKEWNELCHNESLIFPKGSTSQNHRHDQTLLSICYWKLCENNLPNLLGVFGIKIQNWPNKILFFFDERFDLKARLNENFMFQSTSSDKRCKIIVLFNSESLSKIPWRLIISKKVILFNFNNIDFKKLNKYFLKKRFISIKFIESSKNLEYQSHYINDAFYLKIQEIIEEEYKITFHE